MKRWVRERVAAPLNVLSRALILLVLWVALIPLGSSSTSAQPQRSLGAKGGVYLIGHRGAAGLAPENTLGSIAKALDLGVDAVEFDVQLSADGKVVVYHDFRLKPEITRTPDGAWLSEWERPKVKDLTLAELKMYDVGRLKPWTAYARRYPDQEPMDGARIPTLEEIMALLKGRQDRRTQLWIEIKSSPERPDLSQAPEAIADAVLGVLHNEKVRGQATVLSFDWRALVYLQEVAPWIPTLYLSHAGRRLNNIKPGQPGPSPWTAGIDVDAFGGSLPRAVKAAGGRQWAPHYKTLRAGVVQEAHTLGMRVYAWTPDSAPQMRRLMDMDVDGIITNRPDILKSVLSQEVKGKTGSR